MPEEQIISIRPLELLVTEAAYKPTPDSNQQDKLIASGALYRPLGLVPTQVEKNRVLSDLPAHLPDMVNLINTLRRPGQPSQDIATTVAEQEFADVVEFLSPIRHDLLAANNIVEGEDPVKSVKEFLETFPHPWGFEIAWSKYISKQTELFDQETLNKAYQAAGQSLYGKQWEYAQQMYILMRENLNKEALQIEGDVGYVLTPSSLHPARCDDALRVDPEGRSFALADGVGSGGPPSREVARFAVNYAHYELGNWAPTSPENAKARIMHILDIIAKRTRAIQEPIRAQMKTGEKPEGVLYTNSVNAVGILGAISSEGPDSYLTLANLGNCRAFVVGQNGSIKMETRDRTLYYDDPKYQQEKVDSKQAQTAYRTVTTTFAQPKDVDWYRVELTEGDVVIIMSDGITSKRNPEEIRAHVLSAARDLQHDNPLRTPQKWAEDMARVATVQPSHDDVAVIVARIGKPTN
jgi:serine/threonine protein phosphatase PrpC